IRTVAVVGGMRPEDYAGSRIESVARASSEHDQLLPPAKRDEDGRRLRDEEVAALPDDCTIALPERHDRLPRTADRADDRVAVGDGAAAVPGFDDRADEERRRVELGDEIVRPEHAPGARIEREEFLVRADREQAGTDDEGGRVGSGAVAEILQP